MESSTYKPTVLRMGTKTAVSSANISCRPYIETQSLGQTVFKPNIVTFFEEANLHHPTIKFTIKIHWDNVFRHSYIQRHKIQRKSYPWAYILNLVTHRSVKRVWGNFFKIQKNACGLMMDRGYQHNLKEKLQSEINETHRNRSPRSLNKQRGRKRNVAFRGTIPTLSVYCKRSFNGKVKSHTKPAATLLIF